MDLCDECQAFENMPDPTNEQIEKQSAHLRRKDRACNYKDELKSKAKGAPHVSSACFDLQQALLSPHGLSSSFFYKRKLSVYDLSVYELSTSDVVCNIWTEAISARGVKQIASCIFHSFNEQVEKGVKEIFLVSDNCTGQNWSRYMATMLWHAMNKHSFLKK